MLSITLGKSDITTEDVDGQVKITFKQEFKFDPVRSFINGGFCYKPDQVVSENSQVKFDPEMPAPYSKIEKLFNDRTLSGLHSKLIIPQSFPSFMDHFIQNAAIDLKSKATAVLGRDPLPHEIDFAFDGHSVSALLKKPFVFNGQEQSEVYMDEYSHIHKPKFRQPFNHDPSQTLTKFKLGEEVYFFGQEGRVWNGKIKGISLTEALVEGKGLAWVPFDLLHSTLDGVYEAREIEEKEAKEKADRLARAHSFKIGQEAYYLALDCGAYKALKCTIVDMGEYEAAIKLDPIVRRSVVDAKDVFHTRNEANDEIFIRQQALNSRG